MNLQDILEELRDKSFKIQFEFGQDCDYEIAEDKYKQSIAQAKSKIEEMFGEWVPSEKIDALADVPDCLHYEDGWNACRQAILKNMEGE